MISCPEILDKAGSSSRLLQFDGIPRQEVHRSVAAAAALHYQQQQSMQVCTSSDTSGMISLATFQGLQDHQTSQSFQAGGGPSPTESGAPTAVFSYLGDPKSKMRSALQPSALHPPTGTAGVSSLYGRLRSAALTSGTAASSCAAVPSVASSSMGGVSIASSDKDCSSKCQVLSHPQLWTPATAATCNAAAQHASAVAADKSDYLSLLMAATNPPKAADTLDGVSERSLGSVALTGSANVQHLPGHGLVDPGHHLRLMQQLQQLQNERTLAVAGGLVPHSDACSLSAMMNNTMGQPSLQNGSLLNPAPAGVPSPEGLLMQGQQLQLVDHNPNGVTLATQHGTFTASSQTGQQLPGPQSPLHCPSAAGVLRVPPCPASGVSASNLNASLKPDRAQAAITALAGSVHKPDGSNNPLYKTELCRTWAETGSCRYGARCQFAHGQAELRAVVRPPKYKTQPCRTYSLTGKCPYGARCNFIHDGEDHEALLNRNRTDSGLSNSIMSISRLSNCSSGLLGTPGAAMLLGVDAMPDAVAALGGTLGCAATTAGLWGGMPQASTGSAVSAQPGSLTGYPGVLSDDSFSSTLSAISMRTGAVNGLAIPQTVGHNVGGLGGCGGVAVDRSAVVNYAAGNNVLSAPAAMLGLVEAGGVFGGVLGSADACWAQGANVQQ